MCLKKNYVVFDTKLLFFEFIAGELKRYSEMASEQHICLSGGSTPKGIFEYILKNDIVDAIHWNNLHFWWGDERCVSPQDSQSNYGEAMRIFFQGIQIKPENIHPIAMCASDIVDQDYQLSLAKFSEQMKLQLPTKNHYPVFDWIWLGVGEDGHTASLFPEVSDLNSKNAAILARKPDTSEDRISLSANTIRSANRISYLVTGESKAHVMLEVLTNDEESKLYPAVLISSTCGQTQYLLDQPAGSQLPQ